MNRISGYELTGPEEDEPAWREHTQKVLAEREDAKTRLRKVTEQRSNARQALDEDRMNKHLNRVYQSLNEEYNRLVGSL